MTPPDGLAPKRPLSWANWTYDGHLKVNGNTLHAWHRGRLRVLSSLQQAEFHGELRWQWLLSVAVKGPAPGHPQRAGDDELERPLRDFGMQKAEEDNHQPGNARAFFLLCDAKPEDPAACECKETEETVVEPDGYAWQKDRAASAEDMRASAEAMQRLGRLR